jgi:site-specific DNA recombinase
VQRWNLPARWVISTRPAHPALVSEQDYIAAQNMSAPRGPAGSATRQYLLAVLLRCATCGRRLESTWSNGKPAYRCRHGYTSATRPDPGRPKNLYIREEEILPHLAALAILQAGDHHTPRRGRQAIPQLTAPARAAELIDHLRATSVTLTYDTATRTVRTDTEDALAVTVGRNH